MMDDPRTLAIVVLAALNALQIVVSAIRQASREEHRRFDLNEAQRNYLGCFNKAAEVTLRSVEAALAASKPSETRPNHGTENVNGNSETSDQDDR